MVVIELGVSSVMMEGRCSRSWQTGVQLKGPWGNQFSLQQYALFIFVFKEGTGCQCTPEICIQSISYTSHMLGVLYSSSIQRMCQKKLGLSMLYCIVVNSSQIMTNTGMFFAAHSVASLQRHTQLTSPLASCIDYCMWVSG